MPPGKRYWKGSNTLDLRPYYDVLRKTSLLRGMRDDELDNMMQCFHPRVRRYEKGEFLLLAGYENHEVGIILEEASPR